MPLADGVSSPMLQTRWKRNEPQASFVRNEGNFVKKQTHLDTKRKLHVKSCGIFNMPEAYDH